MTQQFHSLVGAQDNLKYIFKQNNFIPMFIAAFFIIDKRQKQSKFPSTDEW